MGYGTGATLKASSDAFNDGIKHNELLKRSEQERELAGKREGRAEAQEGRAQERFGMERELYQRQTKLLNDQQARETLQRELNRGMATMKATGGQVYQPVVDTYNNLMPDGGRINSVTRNPDGTFDVEYDMKGQRMNLKGQTADEFGSFFMSMADPEAFLNMHRNIEATKAEQAAAERLERLKASLKDKATPAQYARAYKEFSDIYDKAYTAGELAGGEPLPGAPDREEWIRGKMVESGFTIGGGAGGAIPGAPNPQREKAMNALTDAFSSMPRLREWLREGGLPVETLMNSVGGGAKLNELENAMTGNDEQSMAVLEKHIREMAGRLGLADISPEEIAQIAGNRRHMPSGQLTPDPGKLGQAWQNISNELSALTLNGAPSLAQLGYRGLRALNEAAPPGAALTPSRDATGRLGPPAEAQIVGHNEQVIPPQALPPQGVVPPRR